MPEALKRLIDIIAFLPGIGEKTAAKLAFFVLKSHSAYRENFAKSLSTLHTDIQECTQCHGMTDHISPLCRICSDTRRDTHILCVVEDYLDMVSIEKSGVYTGLYHILGGAISPIHGITPRSLTFDHLFARIADSIDITEIILATNPNIE
jgi:recombination protein RecR